MGRRQKSKRRRWPKQRPQVEGPLRGHAVLKHLHVAARIQHRYGVEGLTRDEYAAMCNTCQQKVEDLGDRPDRWKDYSGAWYVWVTVRQLSVLCFYDAVSKLVLSVYPMPKWAPLHVVESLMSKAKEKNNNKTS